MPRSRWLPLPVLHGERVGVRGSGNARTRCEPPSPVSLTSASLRRARHPLPASGARVSPRGTLARVLACLQIAALPIAAFVFLLTPATAQTIAERLAPCLACHGENGTSTTPDVPSLGAQPAYFMLIQLFMFRERLRNDRADDRHAQRHQRRRRFAPWRTTIAAAAAAGRRQARPIQRAPLARRSWSPSTAAISVTTPTIPASRTYRGIAGQREDYLVKALRAYKDNTRRGYDAQMADVVEPLTDADFADLAHMLSRMK